VLERHGADKLDEGFDENGAIITVEIAESEADAFTASIMDATRGKASVKTRE